MKIALAQMSSHFGDVEANVRKIVERVEEAAVAGAELIVFPEMSDTGYHPSVFASAAQSWPGPAVDEICKAASKYSIAVVCGLSEKCPETIYNSLAVVDSGGSIVSKYRKIHLFNPAPVHEEKYFEEGERIEVVNIGGIRFGLSICYDLRYPELYRCLALRGAEVLVNVAAWPRKRESHWDIMSRARALENQAFFLGVAAAANEEDSPFNGCSRLVSPRGEILVEAKTRRDELLFAEVQVSERESFCQELPTFDSRRGHLYSDLHASDENK